MASKFVTKYVCDHDWIIDYSLLSYLSPVTYLCACCSLSYWNIPIIFAHAFPFTKKTKQKKTFHLSLFPVTFGGLNKRIIHFLASSIVIIVLFHITLSSIFYWLTKCTDYCVCLFSFKFVCLYVLNSRCEESHTVHANFILLSVLHDYM